MRVGVVSSSKNIALAFKKHLVLIVAISLLYAINYLAIGEIKLIPNTEGGGELRPFIFIPALASIAFGPLVGSFSAGIGNILIDIIADVIIQEETLDLGNLAGFFGNFIGAGVIGLLSQQLTFKKEDKLILSGKAWGRYLQNVLASVVGLGLVCGQVIGLLRVAFGVSSWEVGNIISTSIFYSNSLFLLISMLPLQLVVGIYEKVRLRIYDKAVVKSREVTVIEQPERAHAVIEEFQILPQTETGGLVKGEWSQFKLIIRNNSTVPLTFRLEVNCEDRIDPSVEYTRRLKPQEYDEKFFQINPFNDSDRIITIYIKNWTETYKELAETSRIGQSVRYRYSYTALTPFQHHFNTFTNFLAVGAFAVVIINSLRSIFTGFDQTDFSNSPYFIWALVVCGVEIAIVFSWYLFQLVRVRRKIAQAKKNEAKQLQEYREKKERELKVYEEELEKISAKYNLSIEKRPDVPVVTQTTLQSQTKQAEPFTTEQQVESDREDIDELTVPEIPKVEKEPSIPHIPVVSDEKEISESVSVIEEIVEEEPSEVASEEKTTEEYSDITGDCEE